MRMRRAITAACSLAIAAWFGFGVARAGDPPAEPKQASAKVPPKVDAAQSRTCLTSTGSLIKPKPGHCVNAFGTVYTQDDMRRTDRITPSGALRTLDPSVTLVH